MSDTPRTEAILALLPGGQTCDPQLVADELRLPIAELERELAGKTEAIQDAAKMLDDWRQRARRSSDAALSWEEKHSALERELASAISERDALRKAADKLEQDKEYNADLATTLRCELEDERALADRLAGGLAVYKGDAEHLEHWMPGPAQIKASEALAAWKEARRAEA